MRLQELVNVLALEELTPHIPGRAPGGGQAGGADDRQDDPDITRGYASEPPLRRARERPHRGCS